MGQMVSKYNNHHHQVVCTCLCSFTLVDSTLELDSTRFNSFCDGWPNSLMTAICGDPLPLRLTTVQQ